ncbi:MAG: DNA internalization-related competence protein ComEC/Rec2 [Oscillibacter sp.]|nr:DNA internalization-related competence protein ComEC/Rec2 [Oscillibacter sp.]
MRRLAVFSGAFASGIFLAQYLLPDLWLLPSAFVCLGLGLLATRLPWRWRRRAVVISAALALAFGYNWLYVRQVQKPAAVLSETEQVVTATLCGYAETSSFGARATVRLDGFPGKAVYYGDYSLLDLVPGQTLTGSVLLRDASRIVDEDITTFTSKGVFLLAYARGEPVVQDGTAGSLRWLPARMCHDMQETIAKIFHGAAAGFLTAILTGERSELLGEAQVVLAEVGIYHIMAVSGMHCMFLLGFVSLLTGRRSRLRALVAIPVLVFYAALAGGSPSVVRACIMLSFFTAGPVFRRESDGPTSLTAALLLILLQNPFAAASVSLQLSFAAMAGLLWLTPKLEAFLLGDKKHGKFFRTVTAGLSATMGAMVFTIPLSGYYFGSLVLISPLTNLLCLWAASGVFLLGLTAAAVGMLCPPIGACIAFPASLLANYIFTAAKLMSKIPYHAVYFNNPYLKFWVVYAYLLFLCTYLAKKAGGRKYALAAVLAALTLAVTVKLGAVRCTNDLDAVVLDIGQGQSIILASGGHFALVDCGSSNRWRDAGETAAWQLKSMGCQRLDYIILTHYDSDHVCGVPDLLARLDAECLLVPDYEDDTGQRLTTLSAAQENDVPAVFVTEQETLSLGSAQITIYPPLDASEDNDKGLTILASVGDNDLLITGDMSSSVEKELLETYELPDIEGFVAGHHGSKYSTSKELLQTLKPEIVCISSGSNSYGHPAEETLARIARQGCAIYRTDLQGSIHLWWNT